MSHYLTNFDDGYSGPKVEQAKAYKLAAQTLGIDIEVCEHPMPHDDWEDMDSNYHPELCSSMWSLYYRGAPDRDLSDFWDLARKMQVLVS